MSLSKAYGLISRFSEDIDITVFREDLGRAASVQELTNLSRKKREARIDAIKDACRDYIHLIYARQQACWRRELKPNHLGNPVIIG